MEGKKVQVVDMVRIEDFAKNFPGITRSMLMLLLEENGVELIPENKVVCFTADGVEIEDRNWNHRILKADTVVSAFGTVSNYPSVEHLSGLVPETYVVGDCDVPGNIKAANTSAYLLAARV